MKVKALKFILTVAAVLGLALVTSHFHSDSSAQAATKPSYSEAYKVAKKQLGKPYGWGSTGPSRFDCSGLTKYVFKKGAGKTLHRTAQSQYNHYKKVSYKNIKKGDLVFFGGSKHSISHVGMYIGNGKMIDSQNRGVIVERVKAPWWNYVGSARPVNFAS
ncbi:cell wall-associated hydrolase [Secundilactobacillus oryzae JCM 18671]|uniref:Cell wall-associated hydrolase n=1 Tax=Secundilactobacillus oryzae JCM 18671 TaxID=1291743 RepID=A0A081BIX7_9LACO|nr:NlpC/P60 family protein [Secundilactobacillus oryzae]GAK47995.1 cell wall-associated hydrolase [Secundilactobacillus oryzae JCM 18671]